MTSCERMLDICPVVFPTDDEMDLKVDSPYATVIRALYAAGFKRDDFENQGPLWGKNLPELKANRAAPHA